MPRNFLNLPEYNILTINESDHDYHVKVETKHAPHGCRFCGSGNLVGFGKNEVLVRDIPTHGKRVNIYVQARRYRCKDCKKTFMEHLPAVVPKTHMTHRLKAWITDRSLHHTFASVADEIGITEGTVRGLFRTYMGELERDRVRETPTWMGIDEIHLLKKPRCVITNIQDCLVVDLLEDRSKTMVTNYLMRLKNRDRIICVTMDMWQPYRDAVYGCLPNADVVVDKFHVLRMANLGLETVRKGLRQDLTPKQRRGLMHDRFILLKREADLKPMDHLTLESWTRNFPSLGEAYWAKERFFKVYDALGPDAARAEYAAWLNKLVPGISDAFKPLTTAMANWDTEIFNYFDHTVTNAYTESLNNLIRNLHRMGRGYSFDVIRAKILFAKEAMRMTRPKFARKERDGWGLSKMVFSSTFEDESPQYLGTDISTLAKLLEEGSL